MQAGALFKYLDYRQYLAELTSALKQEKKFNLRRFAREAGIKAPGYLKMVTSGKRNITLETAQKFCRALNIKGREKVYFEKLVLYNQTTDPDLKKEYFDELVALRPRSAHFVVEKKQNRYFSRPYYVVIRELVSLKDFKEDYKWIAKRCQPRISPAEAKEAIEALLKLGLLARDSSGRLKQTKNFIQTEDRDTQVAEAYHFHEAVLNMARHSLAELKQEERNYYALTLPLPKKMFGEIIDEFYEFRDRILNRAQENKEKPEEVYQINFQLFPVTKKEGES